MVNLVAADPANLDICSDFPNTIRVVEDLRIPLSHGSRLSARMWLPENAESCPVPAVIEYIPFRHRDFSAPRDALIHPWFAGHGYASIRLEPRGSQESDGDPMDEYVLQEQLDAVAALDWIASQSWCSGQTGMFGMSWGAFSALQVAAHNPPSLKAIIPVHGTDDRFIEDIHFKGGCLLSANLSWSWVYTNYMMRPPDPALAGEDWLKVWTSRIKNAPFVLPDWVGHQSRDDYWRHGSIREDYDAVKVPTFVFCGWADGYRNAALRIVENLSAPARAIIGPWAHTYPHLAKPGPQIGFLHEATRWWDRWLKGIENGVDKEPKLCLWMLDEAPASSSYETRDGYWIAEDRWPPARNEIERLYMDEAGLTSVPGQPKERTIKTPMSSGMTGGEWLPHGVGPEMPLDQSFEDVGALVFETGPLMRDCRILGSPVVSLKLMADQTHGLINARLSDVRSDGSATMICYGLLNLTSRNGFEHPELLTPGEWFEVTIPLDAIAQTVRAGHRIRLSIGTNAFPLAWPAPTDTTCTLATGPGSFLDLPVFPDREYPDSVPEFRQPAIPQPPDIHWHRPVSRTRRITRDVLTGEVRRRYVKDDGSFVVGEHGMGLDVVATLEYGCIDDQPLSAWGKLDIRIKNFRGAWHTELNGELNVTSSFQSLKADGKITASHNGKLLATREFKEKIPRIFV